MIFIDIKEVIQVKISHTNIHAKKITLLDNCLTGDNFKIDPKYYKKITKLGDDSYKLLLIVEIINTKESPFPLDVHVEFETVFTIKECDSPKEIETFLNINAIQMIYPFMRSALNSVVSAAILPPLVLPIIDVRQFSTL